MSAALLEALDASRREVHLLARERLRAISRFEEIEALVRKLRATRDEQAATIRELRARIAELEAKKP